MKFSCPTHEHTSRRAFLKAGLATAGGFAVANWGGLFNSQTIGAAVQKLGKRCILLWAGGGPSQLETFDRKPGRPTGGPVRPIQTSAPGVLISEYLPKLARQAHHLAVIRSMSTKEGEHAPGTILMHTGRPNLADGPVVGTPELAA